MWDGLFTLLFLCLVMGGASFAAGALPLSFSLSARQLRLLTALGTGVLVGTSLIVIIPEGIETLYSAGGKGHAHSERAVTRSLQGRAVETGHVVSAYNAIQTFPAVVARADEDHPSDKNPGFVTGPDDGFEQAEENIGQVSPTHPSSASITNTHDEDHEPHNREPHAWVGISLITGFILMYLIDTLPQHLTQPTQPRRFSINLTSFNLSRPTSDPDNPENETPTRSTFPSTTASSPDSPHATHPHHRPSSTTLGLVIHAAADGIALGASSSTTTTSSSNQRNLSLIIFLALLLHKTPAAFGLTTTLLKQGLSKRRARGHLLLFSLAAPVGAVVTWFAAGFLGIGGEDGETGKGREFSVGVLLLFSAGTFLYVAMHAMQESSSSASASGSLGQGKEDAGWVWWWAAQA
ncbi:Zinc/iron permease [Hortaea werneckii]|nr:Zinc/iron permease [Hortaea werneckii]